MKDKVLGNIGEAQAFHYLKKNGYRILETNYKNFIGEIDIIYTNGKCLIFGEVKTRTSEKFGLPREAVTKTKQLKIRKVAMVYIKDKQPNFDHFRFDVIEIIDDDVTLIENAF